jgi:hypothetical protein
MKRRLRIAVSVFFAVVCFAMIVLWVRSYSKFEFVARIDSNNHAVGLGSIGGTVYLTFGTRPPGFGNPRSTLWGLRSVPTSGSSADFVWKHSAGFTTIKVPFRYLIPMIAAATYIPWIKWSFSLRTMLIATTLVAVVLGLILFSVG